MGNWKLIFNITVLLAFAACGGVTSNTQQPPPPSADNNDAVEETTDLNHPSGNTAVVLGANFTDPIGTLSLVPINPPRTPALNLQAVHSDAVVRSFGNKLYVVNRLGADNIQVVDPDAGFDVTRQFSVGQGTNPQQIIVTDETKGYVTLYQPEDNNSSELAVDDLLVVNPATGAVLKTIDLTPFTTDDGERLARASAMVIVGGRIFVAIQDLPADLALPANQPGKIVVIDTETDSVVDSAPLAGRDPVAMTYSPETGMIYIADADYFDVATDFGGIERFDPESVTSQGILVDDLLLGGAPGDMEVGGAKGYVTLGFFNTDTGNFATKVVSFPLDPEEPPALTEVYRGEAFIQDIALDENGRLLVGDRAPEVNGILFIDPETKEVIDGPIHTGPSPSSITFIDR